MAAVSTPSLDVGDFVSTKPGTVAGRYMRSFWQPVYRAQDLQPGRTVPLRIMSEDFTLYRGESGTPHLVAFRCAHRASQLSVGWVEDDCIRCRYHGWMYDGSGQCVEQPGEDPDYASKIRIKSWPIQEYLGLLWAYLGEGDPPPIRRYPNQERPGVLEVTAPELLPCNYFNRLENDPSHVVWTHRVSRLRAGVPREQLVAPSSVTADEMPWGFAVTLVQSGRTRTNHSYMPNAGYHHSHESELLPGLVESERITWTVPIDDQSCWHFGTNLMLVTGDRADELRKRLAEQPPKDGTPAWRLQMGDDVLQGRLRLEDMDPSLPAYESIRVEDHSTMVGQGRIADRSYEHLGRIDAGTVMRRNLWRREVQAMLDGRPLTDWRMPDDWADMEVGELSAAR
jgi:5,5'-dehydrodivanillate O-demethylase